VTIGAGARISAVDGGWIAFSDGVVIERSATILSAGGGLSIGPRSFVGTGSFIVSCLSIEIGSDALIAEYVSIRDQEHDFSDASRPIRSQGRVTAAVRIGADVWIGAKATVLKGSTIGDHSIVGANAVVIGDLPANSICVGVPARVKRWRSGVV
jgi:acetyltransferase-like isoleucine patch superfamily enzyme